VTAMTATTRTDSALRARALLAAFALALASGCATTNGDPRDPLEGFNRSMYAFNETFDEAIGKPVATAYKTALPDPVLGWVRNFFANLADVFIGVNNLLQGKVGDGLTDWARFAFNTTVGLVGINDVASEMGLEKHNEDFGQTFGRWGAADGAYLVWPFFGSSGPAPCATPGAAYWIFMSIRCAVTRRRTRGRLQSCCARPASAPTCSMRAASWRRRHWTSTFSREMPTCSGVAA